MESTASTSVNDDAVSQVLGKDKPGRIRGMGRGITATKIAFMQARDSHVLKLEAKQAELQDELRGLKDVVRGLTASKSVSLTSLFLFRERILWLPETHISV